MEKLKYFFKCLNTNDDLTIMENGYFHIAGIILLITFGFFNGFTGGIWFALVLFIGLLGSAWKAGYLKLKELEGIEDSKRKFNEFLDGRRLIIDYMTPEGLNIEQFNEINKFLNDADLLYLISKYIECKVATVTGAMIINVVSGKTVNFMITFYPGKTVFEIEGENIPRENNNV